MHKLGLRLIIGYLLLTATLCAAVWFIVQSARSASQTTEAELAVAQQRKATNRLTVSLIETSTLGENATLRYDSDKALNRYLKGSEKTDSALVRLQQLTTDTLQQARLDSLTQLIHMKRRAMVRLVATLRQENQKGSDLQRQIEELKSGKNTIEVGTQVAIPVQEHDEEVVIERRKKGFFQRLGDAFRRPKTDTLMVTTSTRQAKTDSTMASVDISDTLANILTDVHRTLAQQEANQGRKRQRQSDALRLSGAEISQRIATLLETFHTEQQRILSQASAHEVYNRTKSARQMGTLALAAIVAVFILGLWVWRDMTRANRYRMALEEARLYAENLMKRRELLLLTISHDIKAPVNTMLGYLSLLKPQKADNHPATTHLHAIEAAAKHLLNLVTDLLDYHKLEAGGLNLQMQPVALKPLLEQLAQAFMPAAQAKGLELHTQIDLPNHILLDTDTFRLSQIVNNLLSNAIKYTSHGNIIIKAQQTGDSLKIEVSDTGCGLTIADCQRIFEPFTRAKGSEGQEGTGLGLSITRQLAHLLGAELTVKSQLNQGSTFTLVLNDVHMHQATDTPHLQSKDVENQPANSLSQPSVTKDMPQTINQPVKATCTGKLILVLLDDDTLQLQLTEAMLRNVATKDATICTFNTPDALFTWLTEGNRPHLLFTDIEMPALTGYDVLERVRRIEGLNNLPVVATTSHSMVSVHDFQQRGFTDVLFKPFTQNNLRQLLEQQIPTQSANKVQQETPVSDNSTLSPFAPLLTFAEGDLSAEMAILNQFKQDCQTHLERIEQAASTRNKPLLCQLAHKMLPTHTLIGSEVTDLLRHLDQHRHETCWQDTDDKYAQHISQVLHQLMEQLP